jgi:predicted regulator of Ras-like GTPase activity (Roadblock/LC7/MglB family)
MLNGILNDLVRGVKGASAAVFLDGDGEMIAEAGAGGHDLKVRGAWNEIHLDRIKGITRRLNLGSVHAVLCTLDEGSELIAPVSSDYCLLLLMSPYADLRSAMHEIGKAIELLAKDIE